jgi:hypothetical protein
MSQVWSDASSESDELEAIRCDLRRAGLPDGMAIPSGDHRAFDPAGSVAVLLSWVPRIQSTDVLALVARRLETPFARGVAAGPLLDRFADLPADEVLVKWVLAKTVAAVAGNEDLERLKGLAADPVHGRARQMLVERLGRGPIDADVQGLLLRLLEDADVAQEASVGLERQIGADGVRPHLERLAEAGTPSIAAIARRRLLDL